MKFFFFFLVFPPFVRLNKIGRCFKQILHQAVMTTTRHLNTRERGFKASGAAMSVHSEASPDATECNLLAGS